jgi:hypothetical protein
LFAQGGLRWVEKMRAMEHVLRRLAPAGAETRATAAVESPHGTTQLGTEALRLVAAVERGEALQELKTDAHSRRAVATQLGERLRAIQVRAAAEKPIETRIEFQGA